MLLLRSDPIDTSLECRGERGNIAIGSGGILWSDFQASACNRREK